MPFQFDLRAARKQKGLTQKDAAKLMGVSQAYLSMLENNLRKAPGHQWNRLAEVYGLPSTALAFHGAERWNELENSDVARELAALGYPGFSWMKVARPHWNPAELLAASLAKDELESRVVEGLPWLAYAFSNMDWNWVVQEAKARDVTNRLGFCVTLARGLAERKEDRSAAETLRAVEMRLERSKLLNEQTLCHEQMTQAERRWLRDHCPAEARHWRVLSDLTAEHLDAA